jgi:hypothetical protein
MEDDREMRDDESRIHENGDRRECKSQSVVHLAASASILADNVATGIVSEQALIAVQMSVTMGVGGTERGVGAGRGDTGIGRRTGTEV